MPVDPDIQAAFAGDSPPAPRSYVDHDIQAAFADNSGVRGAAAPAAEFPDVEEGRALGAGTKGLGEAALHTASGAIMGGLGAITNHRYADVEAKYTYQPKTDIGRGIVSGLDAISQGVHAPGNFLLENSSDNLGGDIGRGVGAGLNDITDLALMRGLGAKPEAPAWARSDQSIGAASATFPAAATNFRSPELRAEVGNINPASANTEALSRHAEADSLPVSMRLTAGQATQDPHLLAQEFNRRGATGLDQVHADQNAKLIQNVQAIRDNVGPDVFSTNAVEHGDTLIAAYKKKDAAAQADIGAKYQALRDANGGKFPVDAQKLLDTATANLHDQLLFDHAPKAVMSTLQRLAENKNMTFENFESLRTNLARIQRSSTDGNERAAAGTIRNAMEQMPLADGAEKLKPLADAARSAAKSQFAALEADPAYKAAVNDTVTPDRFVSRFVINGARDDVETMRKNMEDNPEARQTMGVAALDHLRQQAGVDQMGNGNFSQSGFNKHLQALSPKIQSLLPTEAAQQLETLGNVARYTQFQPRGGTFNNSGTLSGAIAEKAGDALASYANIHTGGLAGPVIDYGRGKLKARGLRREFDAATAPLAGVASSGPRAAAPLGAPPTKP